MEFTDAHHHFWDLEKVHYPWLMARGQLRFFGDPSPIQKNYLPQDLLAESTRWVPAKSVHIQVGARPEDSFRESRWLAKLRQQGNSRGLPNAIVAFADLSAPTIEAELEQQQSVPGLRGIRQILGRHPTEDALSGTGKLIGNPAFKTGLDGLAKRGLSFDLQLIPSQYAEVYRLLSRLPELRVAICHAGSPWQQDKIGFGHWQRAMSRFSQLPRVVCKISGLGMFRQDWTAAAMQPGFDHLLACFGPERLMFGSNFPVDRLYGSYDRVWDAFDAMSAGLSPSERDRLFRSTANEFYDI